MVNLLGGGGGGDGGRACSHSNGSGSFGYDFLDLNFGCVWVEVVAI